MYNGKQAKIKIIRKRVCVDCIGSGARGKFISSCQLCKGTGTISTVQCIGNIVTHYQNTCQACSGSGKVIPDDKKCIPCDGKGIVSETKEFTIDIPRGGRVGQRFIFPGEADQAPGAEAGDLIVVLEEDNPSDTAAFNRRYTRRRMEIPPLLPRFRHTEKSYFNLEFTQKIELSEALLGFTKVFSHMDGRVIRYSSPKNKILKTGDSLVLRGQGMPLTTLDARSIPAPPGDLYIRIEVIMPTSLTEKQRACISEFFPLPKQPQIPPTADGEVPPINTMNADMADIRSESMQADKQQRLVEPMDGEDRYEQREPRARCEQM
uniref:DnaJ subfamily A member 2 n=1 Tax=Lygus hesperus TaxID=30085 RepID=A0A0A9YCQ3_LYGHE